MPLVGAAIVAATPWELMIFSVPLFVAWVVWTARINPIAAVVQVCIAATVLVAAILAPVKQIDEVLNRQIILPASALTVAELELATGWEGNREHLPMLMSWRMENAMRTKTVKSSHDKLTLRQFIAEVESQTPLRHRFGRGCGMGITLLYGATPAYLSFRDPQNPYPSDEQSDEPSSSEPASLPLSPPAPSR